MARTKEQLIRMNLDRVERQKLAQLKELVAEYKDLDLYQIAHLELKDRLLEKVRAEIKTSGERICFSDILMREAVFCPV